MDIAAVLQLGIPLALGISLVMTWLITRRKHGMRPAAGWRDDTLDEWREERERERLRRGEAENKDAADE